jgi:L-fucose isomerase-like protein
MKKQSLTVRELEVIKQSLTTTDYLNENELIAKIWKMQREIIHADIAQIRKDRAKELKKFREEREARKSKVVGCLNCGHRTTDSEEIAEWAGCPNCSKN